MNANEGNGEKRNNSEPYRSLRLLDEISNNESLSQRELSQKLNIALGLVNSYLKNLAARGFVKIRKIPPKRFAYYLTPRGFREKSRLTYELLHNYTDLYRRARSDFQQLFSRLAGEGVGRVAFAGVDEVAEIAYLSLLESGIELAGVADDVQAGEKFFNREILPLGEVAGLDCERVVVTTYERSVDILRALAAIGLDDETVVNLYTPSPDESESHEEVSP